MKGQEDDATRKEREVQKEEGQKGLKVVVVVFWVENPMAINSTTLPSFSTVAYTRSRYDGGRFCVTVSCRWYIGTSF